MTKQDKASSAPPLTEAQKAVVVTKLHDYQQAATYSVERTEITNSLTQELKTRFEDLAVVEEAVLASVSCSLKEKCYILTSRDRKSGNG